MIWVFHSSNKRTFYAYLFSLEYHQFENWQRTSFWRSQVVNSTPLKKLWVTPESFEICNLLQYNFWGNLMVVQDKAVFCIFNLVMIQIPKLSKILLVCSICEKCHIWRKWAWDLYVIKQSFSISKLQKVSFKSTLQV